MNRRLVIGAALSGALLLWMAYQIDFDALLVSLASVRYPPLLAAVFVLLLTQVVKAWRWHYLLRPIKSIGLFNLLSATCIGAMTDMVLPARTGEIVRAYLIGEKEDISKVSAFASIVVAKTFDIFTLLLIAVGLLIWMNFSLQSDVLPQRFGAGLLTSGIVLVLLCAGIGIILFRSDLLNKLIERYLSWLPAGWIDRIKRMLDSFKSGLQSIQHNRDLVSIIVLSLALWLIFAASNILILRAFDLNLPSYASFVFLIFQILGVTLPSSPGFIGTYHAAVLLGFAIFQIPQEDAFSVAIVMHAAFFFPFILLGLFFLWRENLSLNEIWAVKPEKSQKTASEILP